MRDVVIEVGTLDALFAAPAADPWAGAFAGTSGMERITEALEGLKRHELEAGVRVVVAVPDADRGPDAVTAALQGTARANAAELGRALVRTERTGRQSLVVGLVFLAVCLGLSTAIGAAESLPGIVRDVLSQGFVIVGWVALWHPTEVLLFDARPLRSAIRVQEAIARAEVVLRTNDA